MYILVMQHFRVAYHGISHESLVFSLYTHELLGECVCKENTSDEWDFPWYATRQLCIAILNHARVI